LTDSYLFQNKKSKYVAEKPNIHQLTVDIKVKMSVMELIETTIRIMGHNEHSTAALLDISANFILLNLTPRKTTQIQIMKHPAKQLVCDYQK
jgi:hypothetical protein